MLDPRLVDALDNDAADQGPRDGGVAEPLDHDSLDLWRRRVEDAVSDVVACEDGPHLPAIGHQEALYMMTLNPASAGAAARQSKAIAAAAVIRRPLTTEMLLALSSPLLMESDVTIRPCEALIVS